jgi:hypothetical protein
VEGLLAATVTRDANCGQLELSVLMSCSVGVPLHECRYFSRTSQIIETIFDELQRNYKTVLI